MNISDLGALLGEVTLAKFERTSKNPMKAQRKLLNKIIRKNKNCELGKKLDFANIHSLEDFRSKVPLSTYEDYDALVDRMIHNREKNIMYTGANIRYCSSSGSVGKPKILPKSIFDLWNMQCCGFSCTVAVTARHIKKHMGKKLPSIMGPLVIILTGHKLEDGKMCNGAGQVPLTYLKPFSNFFVTSPVSLLYPEHEELLDTSYLQLRFALQEEKVSYIGSIVITLVTTMFDYLEENWEQLCDDIEHGTIGENIKITPELRAEYEKKLKPNPKRAEFLRQEFRKGFDTPIAPRIWPRLTFAYGMIGSNLKVYVEKLRRSIGDNIPIHNMGYAAAEGFFAMPTELDTHDSALIPYSIFFEFIPVNDDVEEDETEEPKTLLLDEVEVGKKYELVVTNSSGLYRYRMEDIVQVTRMHNDTPVIEFLYRKNLSMNVANEKTTTAMVDYAAKKMFERTGSDFVGYSFYPDFSSNPPRYCLMTEIKGDITEEKRQEMIDTLDEELKDVNEKYYKYRRWGMLNRPEILILKPNTYWDYRESLRAQGVVLNQIKPVTVINTKPREEFFFSHILTEESSTIDFYNEHKNDE